MFHPPGAPVVKPHRGKVHENDPGEAYSLPRLPISLRWPWAPAPGPVTALLQGSWPSFDGCPIRPRSLQHVTKTYVVSSVCAQRIPD